ncbi:MAG: Hsp20/alpha crystallin family protein [Isosphaeraceae bacterium]|nr:Hsp20/alpha crystallin family protein [Isosphaeraceae bacterium]
MTRPEPRRRWDPFGDFQREVGRFFEAFEPLHNWRTLRPFPAINLYEAEDHYILSAEVPGMAPDELDLSITGDTLTLRGERRRPEGISDESYRRQERPFGRWARTIVLAERIDGSRVNATLAQGVLTVTLPKAEEAQPRHIAVTAITD